MRGWLGFNGAFTQTWRYHALKSFTYTVHSYEHSKEQTQYQLNRHNIKKLSAQLTEQTTDFTETFKKVVLYNKLISRNLNNFLHSIITNK